MSNTKRMRENLAEMLRLAFDAERRSDKAAVELYQEMALRQIEAIYHAENVGRAPSTGETP